LLSDYMLLTSCQLLLLLHANYKRVSESDDSKPRLQKSSL